MNSWILGVALPVGGKRFIKNVRLALELIPEFNTKKYILIPQKNIIFLVY